MTRILKLAFACVCGVLFFTQGVLAEDCSLKEYASLDLAGLPNVSVVKVLIGGKPFNFIVDTGGIHSELDQDVAEALGLQKHAIYSQTEIYDVAGKTSKYYVDVPDVALGAMNLGLIHMVVRDRPTDADSFDGVLAPDLLSSFELDFDFGAKKLNLFSPDHCEGKAVYWSKSYTDAGFKSDGWHVEVTMNLDGHDVLAILDSGSSQTYINERTSKTLFDLDSASPGTERIPDSKETDEVQYRYRFKLLSLGGLAVSNPLINILPDRIRQAFNNKHDSKIDRDPIYGRQIQIPDVIMGMNVLTKLHMFISYKEHKIYVTAADSN